MTDLQELHYSVVLNIVYCVHNKDNAGTVNTQHYAVVHVLNIKNVVCQVRSFGPSIYDVYAEGVQAQVGACGQRRVSKT